LAVGDVECIDDSFDGSGWLACRSVAIVVRLNFWVFELFFGAMIIVRLSRVVVQNRFKFSDFCVLTEKELVLRIISNRPSQIVMPTFQLEYMDQAGKRLHPLDLTNGGSTAYLGDSTFFLRHTITPDSPFRHPDWRNKVQGLRVAVMGYDDLLSTESCGCRYYKSTEISDDHDFADIVSLATIKYKRHLHRAYIVDMAKLNDKKPRILLQKPKGEKRSSSSSSSQLRFDMTTTIPENLDALDDDDRGELEVSSSAEGFEELLDEEQQPTSEEGAP